MHDQTTKIKIDICPDCGDKLEYGFLIGKQNRIRWSCSTKGMTIFHGVPLIKLEEGFWKKWKWWLYAPNIPAKRCSMCRLVIFAYNNDTKENFRNEFWASAIFSGFTFFVAILTGFIVLASFLIEPPISLLLRFVLCFASIVILLLGVIFGRHAFELKKKIISFQK